MIWLLLTSFVFSARKVELAKDFGDGRFTSFEVAGFLEGLKTLFPDFEQEIIEKEAKKYFNSIIQKKQILKKYINKDMEKEFAKISNQDLAMFSQHYFTVPLEVIIRNLGEDSVFFKIIKDYCVTSYFLDQFIERFLAEAFQVSKNEIENHKNLLRNNLKKERFVVLNVKVPYDKASEQEVREEIYNLKEKLSSENFLRSINMGMNNEVKTLTKEELTLTEYEALKDLEQHQISEVIQNSDSFEIMFLVEKKIPGQKKYTIEFLVLPEEVIDKISNRQKKKILQLLVTKNLKNPEILAEEIQLKGLIEFNKEHPKLKIFQDKNLLVNLKKILDPKETLNYIKKHFPEYKKQAITKANTKNEQAKLFEFMDNLEIGSWQEVQPGRFLIVFDKGEKGESLPNDDEIKMLILNQVKKEILENLNGAVA